MFSFSDKFAIIETITATNFSLAYYENYESFRTGNSPIESWLLPGLPSISGCLKVLPLGFKYDGTGDLPEIPPVPNTITARQIRLWLIQHNFQLSQIESAINNIEDPITRETVRIEWEYAPYVERSHAWLVPLAQSLGLNEEQIDQAFREASLI